MGFVGGIGGGVGVVVVVLPVWAHGKRAIALS